MTDTIALWRWALLKSSFESQWASLQLAHPQIESAQTHWVALSGGADSVALLHLLNQLPTDLRPNLKAVHVHHGLSAGADQWLEFCQAIVEKLGIPFTALHVSCNDAQRKEHGIEGWARTARYKAIGELIAANDVVHCAQHQSDQAETLLLALMRGAGPDGQASMPVIRPLASGWLCRPLLRFTRKELQQHAEKEQGEWIHDPSNDDKRFDRNFIRAEILPKFSERWPSTNRSLARSASLAAESSDANAWFSRQHLVRLVESGDCQISPSASIASPSRISIAALLDIPAAVRNQLLRQWVSDSGAPTLPFAKMKELDDSILSASSDKNPFVNWAADMCLARYGNSLWLFRSSNSDLPKQIQLDERIEFCGGTLSFEPSEHGFEVPAEGLRINQRLGGERFRKLHGGQSTLLKKFLNEQGVLPWWRDQIPLFWQGDELVAVGTLWQRQQAPGWQLAWSPEPRILK